MSNADFCCAENFPVLIPYRDLVKIVEVAKNLERYEKCLSRTNEQLVALRSQYTELCEKVREMDKLLCLPSPSPLSVSQRTQKHYFVAFVFHTCARIHFSTFRRVNFDAGQRPSRSGMNPLKKENSSLLFQHFSVE